MSIPSHLYDGNKEPFSKHDPKQNPDILSGLLIYFTNDSIIYGLLRGHHSSMMARAASMEFLCTEKSVRCMPGSPSTACKTSCFDSASFSGVEQSTWIAASTARSCALTE